MLFHRLNDAFPLKKCIFSHWRRRSCSGGSRGCRIEPGPTEHQFQHKYPSFSAQNPPFSAQNSSFSAQNPPFSAQYSSFSAQSPSSFNGNPPIVISIELCYFFVGTHAAYHLADGNLCIKIDQDQSRNGRKNSRKQQKQGRKQPKIAPRRRGLFKPSFFVQIIIIFNAISIANYHFCTGMLVVQSSLYMKMNGKSSLIYENYII